MEGHYHAGVQELGHPVPRIVTLSLTRGLKGTEALELEGLGNRVGALGCDIPVGISTHSLQALGIPGGPTVNPKKEPGQRSSGSPQP